MKNLISFKKNEIILKDGENKFILVTGIKSKFVSGVSEHSDIKYKFV